MGERVWAGALLWRPGDGLRTCSGRVARGVCIRKGAAGEEGLEPGSLVLRAPLPTKGGSWEDLPRMEPRDPRGEALMEARTPPLPVPSMASVDATKPPVPPPPLSSASTCMCAQGAARGHACPSALAA